MSSSDFTVAKTFLKDMTDKLEQHNNTPPQWAPFQPSFDGRPSEHHPFNYSEQHRGNIRPSGDFDNDASRQQPAPFMQNFFPRIGLPFPDFSDYQRFNGFQRNAFFPNPFVSQFSNPTYPFPMNPMHNPMAGMDHFNLSHGQHSFAQNNNTAKPKESIQNSSQSSEDEKPPVLSAEYPVKHDPETKFNSNADFLMTPKDEPRMNVNARMGIVKKDSSFSLPPPLSAEKPFDQNRVRDDVPSFNPPFYSSTMEIGNTNNFKQENSSSPSSDRPKYHKLEPKEKPKDLQPPGALHDCQVCLSTHANGLHFGARTCAACAAFFRRTISDDKRYVCKRNQRCTNASRDGTGYRKICRSCRMKRCIDIGMLPENVQHKRNRRESGSPHPKPTFNPDFFNGFYTGFPGTIPPVTSTSSTQPADPCHNTSS